MTGCLTALVYLLARYGAFTDIDGAFCLFTCLFISPLCQTYVTLIVTMLALFHVSASVCDGTNVYLYLERQNSIQKMHLTRDNLIYL